MTHQATWHEDEKAVLHWLEKGGRPDQYRNDVWGGTALMLAAQLGNLTIVKRLLSHGASPLAVDISGKDALSWARWGEHLWFLHALRRCMGISYLSPCPRPHVSHTVAPIGDGGTTSCVQ